MSEYVLQLPWPESLTEADVASYVGAELVIPVQPGSLMNWSDSWERAYRVTDARTVQTPRRIELTLRSPV